MRGEEERCARGGKVVEHVKLTWGYEEEGIGDTLEDRSVLLVDVWRHGCRCLEPVVASW